MAAKLGLQTPIHSNSYNQERTTPWQFSKQFEKLETKVEEKISKMKLEFDHKLQLINMQMMHQKEMSELKCKLQHIEMEAVKNQQHIGGQNRYHNQQPQYMAKPPQYGNQIPNAYEQQSLEVGQMPTYANVQQNLRQMPMYANVQQNFRQMPMCGPQFPPLNLRPQYIGCTKYSATITAGARGAHI